MVRSVLKERRREPRRIPASDEPLSRMRLRGGREFAVIDISNGGALVEGTTRLLPGTHADVHVVTTEGRTLVRSRIVRAIVTHVDAAVITYRAAIVFEQTIDTAPQSVPADFDLGQQLSAERMQKV